jgi:hypothetical protein
MRIISIILIGLFAAISLASAQIEEGLSGVSGSAQNKEIEDKYLSKLAGVGDAVTPSACVSVAVVADQRINIIISDARASITAGDAEASLKALIIAAYPVVFASYKENKAKGYTTPYITLTYVTWGVSGKVYRVTGKDFLQPFIDGTSIAQYGSESIYNAALKNTFNTADFAYKVVAIGGVAVRYSFNKDWASCGTIASGSEIVVLDNPSAGVYLVASQGGLSGWIIPQAGELGAK